MEAKQICPECGDNMGGINRNIYIPPISNINMAQKLNLNEEKIIDLYLNKKISMLDISKIMGCSDSHIRDILLKNKIDLRGLNQQIVYPLEEEIFNKLLNNDLFHYFLGFYVGDGNKGKDFIENGRFEIGLKITIDTRKLLNDFRNLLINIKEETKQYFENQGTAKITEYYIFHKKADKKYGMLKLRLGLKTLKLKLDDWGLKINRRKCFSIPKYYFPNKDKFGIFLAGLIDADGYFNFNKKLTGFTLAIALGDLDSCENLKKIIKNLFNININIRKEKNYNILFFSANHSYKISNKNFKIYKKYIFPYIRLKKRQVEVVNLIYNERLHGN